MMWIRETEMRKEKKQTKPPAFWLAPDVAKVAAPIMKAHHAHLLAQRVEFVFSREQQTLGGSPKLATASLWKGLKAFFASNPTAPSDEIQLFPESEGNDTDFFVIRVWYDGWRQLDAKQKKYLVDHELCHCGAELKDDGKTVLKIIPHDLEDFNACVERHGLIMSSVKDFAKSIEKGKRVQ